MPGEPCWQLLPRSVRGQKWWRLPAGGVTSRWRFRMHKPSSWYGLPRFRFRRWQDGCWVRLLGVGLFLRFHRNGVWLYQSSHLCRKHTCLLLAEERHRFVFGQTLGCFRIYRNWLCRCLLFSRRPRLRSWSDFRLCRWLWLGRCSSLGCVMLRLISGKVGLPNRNSYLWPFRHICRKKSIRANCLAGWS